MNNKLIELISWAKREILALKTSNVRSSVQMTTVMTSTDVNFTLRKAPTTDNPKRTVSNQIAIIEVVPARSEPVIASCSIDVTDFQGRRVNFARSDYNGHTSFYLYARGNDSDFDVIDSGGVARLSYRVDVTSTSLIALNVTYLEN